MSLTGCKVVSVGRFPFHRGRGETEVARNLLRRQAEALAFRELSDERKRVALENEEQESVPKGIYVLRKIPRQVEKKKHSTIIIKSLPSKSIVFDEFYHQVSQLDSCEDESFSRESNKIGEILRFYIYQIISKPKLNDGLIH